MLETPSLLENRASCRFFGGVLKIYFRIQNSLNEKIIAASILHCNRIDPAVPQRFLYSESSPFRIP
jgi:hypothetical protein